MLWPYLAVRVFRVSHRLRSATGFSRVESASCSTPAEPTSTGGTSPFHVVDLCGIFPLCEIFPLSLARLVFYTRSLTLPALAPHYSHTNRYHLRGAHNLILYGLPDHAHHYPELLAFVSEAVQDSQPVSVVSLFSRFDQLALERIVGGPRFRQILESSKQSFAFY